MFPVVLRNLSTCFFCGKTKKVVQTKVFSYPNILKPCSFPGYTGTNCEINIDMCEGRGSILCQNNATCVDGNVGLTYTCICKPGYASK